MLYDGYQCVSILIKCLSYKKWWSTNCIYLSFKNQVHNPNGTKSLIVYGNINKVYIDIILPMQALLISS